MKNLTIKTNRLIIRPFEQKDFKTWQDAHSSFVGKQNQWDLKEKTIGELNLSNFNKLLRAQKINREQDKFYDFAVFSKTSGELIGNVALMDLARSVFQNAYLGYRVLNPHWKQGFGKEMIKAIFIFAFRNLKLHRIEAGIDPNNRRSIMLARSAGMRKEGLKKKALFLDNKWQNIVIYSLTCEDLKMKFKGNLKTIKPRLR